MFSWLSDQPDVLVSHSAAGQQNPESCSAAAGSGAPRGSKDLPARRKDDAKQAAKKPKENALSQFDLNNYASKEHALFWAPGPSSHVLFGTGVSEKNGNMERLLLVL